MVWPAPSIGAVTGGALARAVGALPTPWVAAFGGTTAVLWLVLSPGPDAATDRTVSAAPVPEAGRNGGLTSGEV